MSRDQADAHAPDEAVAQPRPDRRPVRMAAVDDDRLLLDGLTSCMASRSDIALVHAVRTIDELLALNETVDVVALDLQLKDGSDPVDNVVRLVAAGYRVLVVSSHTDREHVIATTSAGADGYVTKDHDMNALVAAVQEVAAGGTAYSPELAYCWARDQRPERPTLSEQERRVVVAYASGATLGAAARAAGIKPGTAKVYLDRVKAKYRQAHRPAQTKLELAERLREDGLHRK
jgi:DNA-binding NarL/FixJ family response regulator